MRRRVLLAAGTAAVACGALPASESSAAAAAPAAAAGARTPVPDVGVVDQDGRAFRFYDDLVRGKVVLVNVFFTACGDTCPLVTENLRAVQDLLGDRVGRDILMLSVTLQPELETPAVLKDYAQQWDVKPGWHFLTGRPAEIEALRRGMGFTSADPAYDLVLDNHTGLVRYGNDRLDRWAGVPGLARPAWIAKAVSSIAQAPA